MRAAVGRKLHGAGERSSWWRRETRWSTTSPQGLQQQLCISSALGETTFTEEVSWLPQSPGHQWESLLSTIPRPPGRKKHACSPGLPGEWHVWGTDLRFTLQSALRNVLGLPPVSCTWWAGRHVARVSRTAGRGRRVCEWQRQLLEAAIGKMKASKACLSSKENTVKSPVSRAHCVQLFISSTYFKGTGLLSTSAGIFLSITDTLMTTRPPPVTKSPPCCSAPGSVRRETGSVRTPGFAVHAMCCIPCWHLTPGWAFQIYGFNHQKHACVFTADA